MRGCWLLMRVVGGELRLETQPGAVEALAEAIWRLAYHGSGLGWGEPVPADECERFAVALAQARERGPDPSVFDVALPRIVAFDMRGLRFGPKAVAPRCTPPLGSHNVTRDSEKPRQRRIWHLLQPPPDDEKRLGDDVIDRLRRRTAPGISPDRGIVLPEQGLEPHSPVLTIWHIALLPATTRA